MIEDDTLANTTGRAIIAGFVGAGTRRAAEAVHRALLRGDTRRLGAAVQRGRPDRGRSACIRHWDISDAGIAAADEFLGRTPEVPPALRRLVLEGQAGVEAVAAGAAQFDAA